MLRSPVVCLLFPLLILTAVVLLTFGSILRNDFVNFDDQAEVIENPDFNPVTFSKLQWNWTHTRLTLYMPVTYMTWGAVAAVAPRDVNGVLKPIAFHALSLGLHLLCAALVYLLILQLWHRPLPALLGALAFAVHPLQAEAVAWASGMYTLLSSAMCSGALLAYVLFASRSKMRTTNIEQPLSAIKTPWPRNLPFPDALIAFSFSVATLLYAAALLTKAASVSLPPAAAVIDLFILGRPLRKVIKPISFWILLGIPVIFLAKHFQDVSAIPTPPLWARPMVALDAIGFYLRKMVLPIHLIPDYGRNPGWVTRHRWIALLSILTAVGAILCAWFARRNFAWITAAIGLLIAGIAPYLGLTAFDFQYVSTVADRYAYFGMIGAAVFIAAIAIRSRLATVLFSVAICVWSVMSFVQVQKWRDTNTLFKYTLSVNPDSLLSHNVFGFLAARQGHRSEAEAHYLKALQIWPADSAILFNLGNLYFKDRPDLARMQYELAVQYQPRMAIYHNSLAATLARLHDPAGAFDQWRQAIAIDPDYIDAHNNLADLCLSGGKIDLARVEYQAVVRVDPDNVHAQARLKEMNGMR